MNFNITNYQGIIFDLDGVIYSGNSLIPGAKELTSYLQRERIPFIFLTNNSSKSVEQISEKLTALGLNNINTNQVLSSAVAVGLWLTKNISIDQKIFIYGMNGLREQVLSLGYQLTEDQDADLILAGLNMDITYEKLARASLAIQNGARLVASNADLTYPTERGLLPGAGSTLKALTSASGKEPEVVLGKPSKEFFALAEDLLQVTPSKILMIGDRLDTDILGAKQAGMNTLLVLTGVTKKSELASSEIRPDYILESLLNIEIK